MKIITLTLNPAFDMHCVCDDFKPYNENFASISSYEAGGKGINISRALCVNGIENTAYVIVGNQNKDDFLNYLKKDNVCYKEFTVSGRIRENITLHTVGKKETRISFLGFNCNNEIIFEIQNELFKENLRDCVVTLTGSVPDGVDVEAVKQFLKHLKEKGARVVIDSRSFTRDDIVEVSPWLIKPNEEEIKMYSNNDVTDINSGAIAARVLHKEGIENVMISLGSRGAVLCNADGVFAAQVPNVDVVSTIGAGDSTVAGFLDGAIKGVSSDKMLKNAVAYGSAACLKEGSAPPQKSDIAAIYNKVIVYTL